MVKQGIAFDRAMVFDASTLYRMPSVQIQPTLEYDAKVHTLSGPLISTVLSAAGVALTKPLSIVLRAVDGYNVAVSLADLQTYRMVLATHMDGRPLALGGLGPLWAVLDADRVAPFKDKPLKERFALWALPHRGAIKAVAACGLFSWARGRFDQNFLSVVIKPGSRPPEGAKAKVDKAKREPCLIAPGCCMVRSWPLTT